MMMVLSLSASALAAATIYAGAYDPEETNTTWTGSGSITVNLPQDSSGNYPSGSNTFKIYKVFDGTNSGSAIAYTSRQATLPTISGTGEAQFFADDAGNIHYGTYAAWVDGTDSGAYYYVGVIK